MNSWKLFFTPTPGEAATDADIPRETDCDIDKIPEEDLELFFRKITAAGLQGTSTKLSHHLRNGRRNHLSRLRTSPR